MYDWKEYKNRAGRPRKFETPEDLWNKAVEYFEWVDKNPFVTLKRVSSDKKGDETTEDYKKRPYTIHGFCVFAKVNTDYWNQLKRLEGREDFSRIIKEVEDIIYSNKFEGATSGLFNPNIIARDLGLIDKQEINQKTKIENPYEGLSEDELKRLAKED